MSPEADSVIGLANQLGEKLGGEPWAKAIPSPPLIAPPVRLGRADVWPADVLEEIRRFYAEEDGK